MKTRQLLLAIYTLAIFSFLFSSCDKESGDTTPPIIRLISPQNDQSFLPGDTIHLEMELSDNEMLSSYKIEIHIGDGHDHKQTKAETKASFTFNKSWDVLGKQNVKIDHKEIVIPSDATPGEYHFVVYCTDAVGEMSQVVNDIIIEDKQ